jgi:mannose-6-phosphate isomerase-like protein (cupin superfamily)
MTTTDVIADGFARPAEAGERYLAMGALVTIIVPSAATNGRFSVSEHVVPPTGGPPAHTHSGFEYLHVLEGTFDVWVGDLETAIPSGVGATIFVPPGVPHTTRNSGTGPGRQLSIYVPGGDDEFFRAIGVPVSDGATLPDLRQPPDLSGLDPARIQALAAQFGMHLVGSDRQS